MDDLVKKHLEGIRQALASWRETSDASWVQILRELASIADETQNRTHVSQLLSRAAEELEKQATDRRLTIIRTLLETGLLSCDMTYSVGGSLHQYFFQGVNHQSGMVLLSWGRDQTPQEFEPEWFQKHHGHIHGMETKAAWRYDEDTSGDLTAGIRYGPDTGD